MDADAEAAHRLVDQAELLVPITMAARWRASLDQWLFWSGVWAVVAGGVVVAVLLAMHDRAVHQEWITLRTEACVEVESALAVPFGTFQRYEQRTYRCAGQLIEALGTATPSDFVVRFPAANCRAWARVYGHNPAACGQLIGKNAPP